MVEQSGRGRERALVNDDGRWYDAGTLVRLEREPAQPSRLRLVVDGAASREVVACRRLRLNGCPMLEVTLRQAQRCTRGEAVPAAPVTVTGQEAS